jgi:hypothetical protein
MCVSRIRFYIIYIHLFIWTCSCVLVCERLCASWLCRGRVYYVNYEVIKRPFSKKKQLLGCGSHQVWGLVGSRLRFPADGDGRSPQCPRCRMPTFLPIAGMHSHGNSVHACLPLALSIFWNRSSISLPKIGWFLRRVVSSSNFFCSNNYRYV